ncbi:hypothetical protein B0I37DRAFT_430236 [Chaetomium sp. MPI-CAGE-AT-0009]|nr:hypothetical protein B0I37DRAFT_430236 [Chaetomium sp. MPI-CAGE-AT-0009]
MAKALLLRSCAALMLAHLAFTIDIPATPMWPSGQCTDKSLTIPSWIISDYKSSSGATTFSVANRASDTAGSVSCASSACTVSGSAKLSASLLSDSAGPLVTLEEGWNCSDLGQALYFHATGRASISSLQCSGDDCSSPISYLAYGSLSSPAPLTPAQPSPPKGYNASTCADVDRTGLWTVTHLSFQNYTQYQCDSYIGPYCQDLNAHEKGLYLSLSLRNHAIDWDVTCDLLLPEDPTSPLAATPVSCAAGGFNGISVDVTWEGVAPDFQLQIDSVHYCLENPDINVKPSVIVATGSISVPMTCSSRPGTSGQADDVVTICTDASSSRTIDGKLSKKESEPAFSLVTATPASGGCTVNSLVNPTWRVGYGWFMTRNNMSLSEVAINLENPAFGLTFVGPRGLNNLPGANDPSTVYDCQWGNSGNWLPWNCTFALNWETYMLTLNQVWECSDKDSAHPLYFTGDGTIDLAKNPNYRCTNDQPDQSYCQWRQTTLSGTAYPIPKVAVGLKNVEPPKPPR